MRKLFTLLFVFALILVSCDGSKQSPIYKDENGIIKCENCEVGFVGEIDGVSYKVVDSTMLKTMVKNNEDLRFICTSKVTNMRGMFYYSKFNKDISNWDVSNVTNMSYMFAHSNFNGDISNWDVSNVTNMYEMFRFSKFKGDIWKWDVSNVTNMNGMFLGANFNGDISNWDVSNVTDMSNMFMGSQLNGDLSNWDLSSLINCEDMFDNSSKLPWLDRLKFKCSNLSEKINGGNTKAEKVDNIDVVLEKWEGYWISKKYGDECGDSKYHTILWKAKKDGGNSNSGYTDDWFKKNKWYLSIYGNDFIIDNIEFDENTGIMNLLVTDRNGEESIYNYSINNNNLVEKNWGLLDKCG